ncbi:hypothetical protein UPYG_G00169320 [Umbra pygmaea]|uniref:WH1 domain-containing protein n=1 Tax=Umbra pygmaea TaxID=75934 RepID=A0ABD0WP54_UMBPY
MTHVEESGSLVFSNLLTTRENALIVNLLGAQCKAVASAVAQVYVSLPGHQTWRHEGSGVVCLVKDCSQHTYFLRLYCIKRTKLLWEQELYIQFQYSTPRPFFHTFAADDCQAGLNFADEAEAEMFSASMQTLIKQASVPNLHPSFSKLSSRQLNLSDSVDSSGSVCAQEQSRAPISTLYASETGSQMGVNPVQGLCAIELAPPPGKLFMKAGLKTEGRMNTHTSEVISSLISSLGGLEFVRTDNHMRVTASQTLPKRSTRTFTALALRKGPLPPLPSCFNRRASSLEDSESTLPPGVPPTPSMPAPPPPSVLAPPPPSMPAPILPAEALAEETRKRSSL